MWENIVAVFAIVILSFVFRQKTNVNFDSQMLFILLTLVGLVFYKMLYLRNLNIKNKATYTENYDNLDEIVNNFANNNKIRESNNNQNVNKEMINQLKEEIDLLKTKLSNPSTNNVNYENSNINLENMSAVQLANLEEIDEKIKNLFLRQASQSETQFKPIPLYNSCVSDETIEQSNEEKDKSFLDTLMTKVCGDSEDGKCNINLTLN